jgi:hypothetical protein
MKTFLIIAAFFAASLSLTSCAGSYYVSDQPADVVYTRPGAPGPGYVWIDGDWIWSGGRYTWHEGRWDRPREGRTWHAGSWSHGARGYSWNRGHW